MLPLWSRQRISSAASERRLRPWPTSRSGMTVRCSRLVVAQVGPDRAVPVDLVVARPRRPRAAVQRAARRRARAVREPPLDVLDDLPHDLPRDLPARLGQRVAAGSSASPPGARRASRSRAPPARAAAGAGRSRSIASCCTTRTTPLGKCERSSPSQRATLGADAPSPPCRAPYTASSAPSIPRSSRSSSTPVPSASSPPSTSRHRRSRSSLIVWLPSSRRDGLQRRPRPLDVEIAEHKGDCPL